MNILLDTHVFIWWQTRSRSLPTRIKEIIADPQNVVYLSCASIWEIAIKKALGKLKTPGDIKGALAANYFFALPIGVDHALAVQHLPKIHKDPFDRMLIAQAQVEGLTIVTHDRMIKQYDVPVVF